MVNFPLHWMVLGSIWIVEEEVRPCKGEKIKKPGLPLFKRGERGRESMDQFQMRKKW